MDARRLSLAVGDCADYRRVAMSDVPSDTLDRPLRDLRISVTDRCNFRCGYCMPADIYHEDYNFLPSDQLLDFDGIERLTRIFVGLGVEKVRITGGEPLLRPELPKLIARLARIDGLRDLTLTTNGYMLADHAQALADAGLQRITVSLDSLEPEAFARNVGVKREVARVLAGIDAAEAAGLSPIKLNCVVRRGVNESAVEDLTRRFRDTPHVVRFIEYMDVGTLNRWHRDEVVPADEILARVSADAALESVPPSYKGEVARRYRYADHTGEIGVIASVTQPFCGDCNRARISADGRLITCLFATEGRDLATPMQEGDDDDALRALITETWSARTDRYSEQRAQLRANDPERVRLEMYQIGG